MKIADYAGEDPELIPTDYRMAMLSQGACNLAAIVEAFAVVIKKIAAASSRRGRSSEWINHHPICVLYSTQIIFLARGSTPALEFDQVTYFDAHNYCTSQAGDLQTTTSPS